MTISNVNVCSGEANAADSDKMPGTLKARRPQLPAMISLPPMLLRDNDRRCSPALAQRGDHLPECLVLWPTATVGKKGWKGDVGDVPSRGRVTAMPDEAMPGHGSYSRCQWSPFELT